MKKLRIFALLTALLLLLVSCSGTDDGTSPSQSPSSGTSANTSSAPSDTPSANTPDPFGKYEPGITVTSVRQTNAAATFADGEDYENNIWTRLAQDELGISMDYLWIAEGTDYSEKLNLLIGSNALPDILRVDATQLNQLVEFDMVEDLTDIWKEYADPWTVEDLSRDGGHMLQSGNYDGRMMGIPYIASKEDTAAMLWIRKDWLDKLNLDVPKSMQDVIEVARAFVNNDPNGNGQNDELGIGMNGGPLTGVVSFPPIGFHNSYHAYPGLWVKQADGTIGYGDIQPEFKQSLLAMRDLYAEGIIDPDFVGADDTHLVEQLAQQRLGMFYSVYYISLMLQPAFEVDTGADWIIIPIQSIDSNPATPQVGAGADNFYVVRKGYEHPEALVKLMNLTKKYGDGSAEHERYMYDETGRFVAEYIPIPQGGFFNNMRSAQRVREYMKTGVEPESWVKEDMNNYNQVKGFADGNMANWMLDRVFNPETGSLVTMEAYVNGDLFERNAFYGVPPASVSEFMPILTDLETQIIPQIVLGLKPPEAFDDFVAQWKSLGGDQITKDINEAMSNR
ncbi:sugar ABC transporter substrate-binding protein [Clostridia bacterium]|nr:sugar ABC transporter substrate-binding protein [Clostridia bacterium]